jgi:stalled ribosome rescue protein Dom34
MKQKNKKHYAGVWLDHHKAVIITNTPEEENSDYAIKDHLLANEHHGGGSEHSINNAKHADMVKYFKSVSNLLLNYDEILVFGPGTSQEQFQHHLQENVQFKSRQITIDSAEQLTDPQMIAKVRDFFKSRQS